MVARSGKGQAAIGVVRLEVLKMEQDARLLPVVKLYGEEFVVDVDSREFRDVDDPENVVNMHSAEGRRRERQPCVRGPCTVQTVFVVNEFL